GGGCSRRVGRQVGQTFVIENRPGAGGTIGANMVAKAEPDGHTILVYGSIAAANALYARLPSARRSQVVGAGPQLGFIIPLSTTTQGYLNLKSYWEFANQNRPDGWNAWVTFVISPAEQTARRMITK